MGSISRTMDQASLRGARAEATEPVPGLLLVFSVDEPLLSPLPLEDGELTLGRGEVGGVRLEDQCLSRRHARVSREGRRWIVRDLGSRNGSAVDGEPVTAEVSGEDLRVLRLGESLLLFADDLRPFVSSRVEVQERLVIGPTLRRAWEGIARAAQGGDVVHFTGESGAGKELAARAFHELGPAPKGPFVAVNCAAIPEGVAERLLFGAQKGAYSGADADAEGYVQAASSGTLFLDELGELELSVQAKLLRVLESREVLPLGASKTKRVDIRICSATHHGLRDRVAEKRFREDLYFRIGRPEVALPPLRERREEIPYLIERELRRLGRLGPHASLVEACLLRRWPGNVRELLAEVRDAGRAALSANETIVDASRLAPTAGVGFAPSGPPPAHEPPRAAEPAPSTPPPRGPAGPPPARTLPFPTRAQIEDALRREQGRVASAARVLGIHRTQLRRWLAKHGVDARSYGGGEAPDGTGTPEPGA